MVTLEAMFNVADKSTPGCYVPSQTALLLLDFHSMFVQKVGGPNAPAALEIAAQMRAWAKSQGIQVIHGLVDINATIFPTCKDADRLAGVIAAAITAKGSEESPELLEGGDDDVTFTRNPGYMSSFKSPDLDEFLQKKGIQSLIITGLRTSGCVLRTATTASDAEYVVSVISDGCADPVEGMHDLMVGKILSNGGYVTTAAEFQEGFAKAMGGK